jgi:hypothetical protein
VPRTRLATVVRAFFLQLPVSTRDAVHALGRSAVEALEVTGLAAVGDDVVPRVRILPVGALLVASDDYPDDDEDPPDYVAAYTPTSRVCDCLTPRRRVERALDLGTGSGVQAMLAARHAGHVVATDINPRALAYTELNAALNGFTNIECRRGSLFEPVEGESFDLITSNAPYVVSPEHRFAYRDAGLPADELSERVVLGRPTTLPKAVSQLCSSAGSPTMRTHRMSGRSLGPGRSTATVGSSQSGGRTRSAMPQPGTNTSPTIPKPSAMHSTPGRTTSHDSASAG